MKLFALFFLLLALSQDMILFSGDWVKKRYEIKGTWKIVQSGNHQKVILEDDFSTKNAPDLKLFLSKAPLNELSSDNALDKATFITELESNIGGQSYDLPSTISLESYKTIIIHCEKYSVLWGGASL